MRDDVFVFAIAYNCGKILNVCLDSFHKFHNQKIHIFGTYKDFKEIKKNKNNEFIDLNSDDNLREYFKQGHLGTSYVWTKVIRKEYGKYSKIIQIDSDVVFKSECVGDIIKKFDDGYDLIGPRRCYEKNVCKRDDVRGINLQDVVSTYFVGINIDKISKYDFNTLHRMIVGYHNPLGHPIIDFLDPVSFDILNNGGKIYYLNHNDYGSMDENGSLINGHSELNDLYDCGNKIIHFAGIGSGANFYYNGNGNVPQTYTEWAKKRFALFMKVFYEEKIFGIDVNDNDILKIKNYISE